jgi:hypothetical protein
MAYFYDLIEFRFNIQASILTCVENIQAPIVPMLGADAFRLNPISTLLKVSQIQTIAAKNKVNLPNFTLSCYSTIA